MLIALVTPLVMQAQVGIGLGIKGGANFSNQAVQDVSTSSITDFHVGGYLNLNLTKKFGITPEVLFSANGSKWDDVTVETDYISVPVMLRYMPVSVLSLQAGPQVSFLTKAESGEEGDIMDQVKKNDFGLAFGAGLHLPLGINAGLRYVLGFTNISEVSGQEIKNRTFQVYVGWTFLGSK